MYQLYFHHYHVLVLWLRWN